MNKNLTLMHESCRPICHEKEQKCKAKCNISSHKEGVSWGEKDVSCTKKCLIDLRRCLDACS